MKFYSWMFAAAVPVALMAAKGPFGAQIGVLGVAVGIFLGTLALGRPQAGSATTTQH